jgi:cytochrome P450
MGAEEESGQRECPGAHFAAPVLDEVVAAYVRLFTFGRIPRDEATDKWGMAHIVPHTALPLPRSAPSPPHLGTRPEQRAG